MFSGEKDPAMHHIHRRDWYDSLLQHHTALVIPILATLFSGMKRHILGTCKWNQKVEFPVKSEC